MLLALFVTGLMASVALADTGTKSVVSVPGLLRAPVVQGARFVVNGQGQVVDSVEQGQLVTSSLEPNVVLHQEVPQEPVLSQQAFYGSPQSYSSPSVPSRRYVPVYAPYYANAVHYVAQPQVLGVDPISAPLQFLIRTPTGPLLFRQVQVTPQPYQQPPVQYVVGVVPSTRPVQPIQGQHVLVTKAEAPVSYVDASNETQSSTLTLASSSGNTVTDVNAGHSSPGEPKTDSVTDF